MTERANRADFPQKTADFHRFTPSPGNSRIWRSHQASMEEGIHKPLLHACTNISDPRYVMLVLFCSTLRPSPLSSNDPRERTRHRSIQDRGTSIQRANVIRCSRTAVCNTHHCESKRRTLAETLQPTTFHLIESFLVCILLVQERREQPRDALLGLRFPRLQWPQHATMSSGVENAPTCFRAPRWPDPEFPQKIPKKIPPGPEILDSQNLPSKYPENTEKIPPKYQKCPLWVSFRYFGGIFLGFQYFRAGGISFRYFFLENSGSGHLEAL